MAPINLDVALQMAERGFYVIPVDPAKGKKPRIKWKACSTRDPDVLARHFRKWPDSLVGLNLRIAGKLVLDGDRHPDADGVIEHDGVEALRELFPKGSLRDNPITFTAGGGVHIWFSNPLGLGNKEGDLPDGINVRGAGGLVIAPGCVRPDGRTYRPARGHPAIWEGAPDLPQWLVDVIRPQMKVPPRATVQPLQRTGTRHQNYAIAVLNELAKQLAGMMPETGRNNALNNAAYRLGTMINRNWIDRSTVEQALGAAAIACSCPGWPETLASGLNAGILVPHADLKVRR